MRFPTETGECWARLMLEDYVAKMSLASRPKKMARYCGIVLLPLHFCLTLSGFCVYACFIVSFWILVWAV